MNKIKNEKQANSSAFQVENVELPKKKQKTPLSKKSKIWIACSTALVLVLASVGTLLGVLLSPKLNWHGLSIANYKSYSGIGAASFGDKKTASAVAYASSGSSGKESMKLAGITQDNTCEEISFVNEKGKTYKQKARLIHFDAYDKFTLFTLTTDSKKEFIDRPDDGYQYSFGVDNGFISNSNDGGSGYERKNTATFILDNETGKIYDINEIAKTIDFIIKSENSGYKFNGFSFINLDNRYTDIFSKNKEPINQKNLLLMVESRNGYYINYEVYQAKLADGRIEVSKRISATQVKNLFIDEHNISSGDYRDPIDSYLYQDIYGNILKKGYYSWDTFSLIQKNDGKFVTLDSDATYTLGINNIFYKTQDEKTYYLNEAGEFVEIDFSETIINGLGTQFYYKNGNTILCGDNSNIYKITLDATDAWKYTLETFEFVRNSSNLRSTEAQGKYVYHLDSLTYELTKFNIETNQKEVIDSQYTFKELKYNKNTNKVTFKAVDKTTRLEVDGYFDQNGEIFIGDFAGVSYGNNRVYIIKPIN